MLQAVTCSRMLHAWPRAFSSAGFAVTGTVDKGRVLRKGGMVAGQHLILTKPLGSGVLLAAHMRRLAKSRWVAGDLQGLRSSGFRAGKFGQDPETVAFQRACRLHGGLDSLGAEGRFVACV